ncbi:MAG: FAD:protein FMN transferase [Gammaproteobacteria bacterium]|nr:FAD:protein FMN transferase [Gammaproteobacteria bacterium]
MKRCFSIWSAAVSVIVLGAAWPVHADWYRDAQDIMGTRVQAELWHHDAAAAQDLLDAVMAEMRRIDHAYSTHRDSSELSALNRQAAQGWAPVSAELYDLLERSRRVSELTEGAFDVTYASVGRYYDYRAGKRPDPARFDEAVEAIDYRYVELDPDGPRVRYAHPQVHVDLGGIAKGYAYCSSSRRCPALDRPACSPAESRHLGDRGVEPRRGIRDPRDADAMAAVLPLTDTAVSTSGDYERFFEEDGVRYHHILDPATGRSARDAWSVTILGPDATFTDALSTSVFVLGPERGLALIDDMPGIDAIIIDASGRLRYSADLLQAADGGL